MGDQDERLGISNSTSRRIPVERVFGVGDGAQVDKLVRRYFISESEAYERLLICVSP